MRPSASARPPPPPRAPRITDAALLLALASGDAGALGELYARHGASMMRSTSRVVGTTDVEDVLHDVMIEVWRRAADFQPSRGSARVWLGFRMRSRAIDRVRTPWATRVDAWSDELDERPDPDSNDEASFQRLRVQRALAQLTPLQRQAIELCYFADLDVKEIAKSLECPVGTVKSRLSAARARLRTALA